MCVKPSPMRGDIAVLRIVSVAIFRKHAGEAALDSSTELDVWVVESSYPAQRPESLD